ncbi:glycoside hydrolase family 25 protein [Puia dinghuensis]|uniref:Lysozyme n=1 Tax=Puia dinghuensis TaxID=1792502 RepID=A0A8J2UIY8_9BACT|nr:glycoside hydrolase family 25 protein [Puia dinghuensis]GGB24968.1 hypothetical protein GCM10011511_56140 [Puia dinghuensis]
MTRGIDISHHNSDDPGHTPIDWQRVAAITSPAIPPQFAIIKISEGADFRDAAAAANAQGAGGAGILFGYYHFARPGVNAAAAEAANFYNAYAAIGIAPTFNYPFALDLEENNGLMPAAYLAWVEEFLQTFTGYFGGASLIAGPAGTGSVALAESVILIYGQPDFLTANLAPGHTLGSRFPLWVAGPGRTSPALPLGWTDWAVWQYDWHAAIPGIVGDVDANWMK